MWHLGGFKRWTLSFWYVVMAMLKRLSIMSGHKIRAGGVKIMSHLTWLGEVRLDLQTRSMTHHHYFSVSGWSQFLLSLNFLSNFAHILSSTYFFSSTGCVELYMIPFVETWKVYNTLVTKIWSSILTTKREYCNINAIFPIAYIYLTKVEA